MKIRHLLICFFAFLSLLQAMSANATTAFKVQISGQGRAMILIPGLNSPGEVWDSTVAHYRQQYRCYVLTLAGFAGTPPIEGSLLEQAEKELAQYIVDEKLDHPIIVGHSLGGFLAMRLAADFPERVGKMVIVDSLPALGATQIPTATPAQLKEMATQMRAGMLQQDQSTADAITRKTIAGMVTDPADVERILAWKKSDRITSINAMYDMFSTDLRQDISKINNPTLVLGTWIAFKDYAPKTAIENTFHIQYAKLPKVKIEIADHARHFIMYDDPQWMFERMDAFLQ